mgnify:CR=1 FL=1
MKNIEEINQHNVKKILSEKKIPEFHPGDVIKVGVRITEAKEKQRQQALEIKRIIDEEEKVKQEIINEQNVLKNQVIDTPSPQVKENKTPYLWIGLGAVVLVGATILIVKKS